MMGVWEEGSVRVWIHLFAKREFNEKMDALLTGLCYNMIASICFVKLEGNFYTYYSHPLFC